MFPYYTKSRSANLSNELAQFVMNTYIGEAYVLNDVILLVLPEATISQVRGREKICVNVLAL